MMKSIKTDTQRLKPQFAFDSIIAAVTLLVLSIGVIGCFPTYSWVKRSALVPATPLPPGDGAHRTDSRRGAVVGAEGNLFRPEPSGETIHPDEPGIYYGGQSGTIYGGYRWGSTKVGFLSSITTPEGAQASLKGTAPLDDHRPATTNMTFFEFSIPAGRGTFISLYNAFGFSSVPYRSYECLTCSTDEFGDQSAQTPQRATWGLIDSGRTTLLAYSHSLRIVTGNESIRFFGGAGISSTVVNNGFEYTQSPKDDSLESKALPTVHAGMSWTPTNWISLNVKGYSPILNSNVLAGFGLTGGLELRL